MADHSDRALASAQSEGLPSLHVLRSCGCGPGCQCGCQSGGPCQCGGSCG
jgi:hypothetical protein